MLLFLLFGPPGTAPSYSLIPCENASLIVLRPALQPGFLFAPISTVMISPILPLTGSIDTRPVIHILHENSVWVEPLIAHLELSGLPYREWFIDEAELDMSALPPEGIFYNRMSASSHTRDHRFAWEATRGVMAWLESHSRRVINNRRATALEVSKVEQVIALRDHGLPAPHTVAATGANAFRRAAARWDRPFIVKPNRGGKGTGVTLVHNAEDVEAVANTFESYTLDGTVVLQDYMKPAEGRVLRLEFIGGRHYYTVSIDTGGGFDLCPSDACQVGTAFCPADGRAKFEVLESHHPTEVERCLAFLSDSGMEVAAMEASPDAQGRLHFYDVNINTNYNAEAEARWGNARQGMRAIAEFLSDELVKVPSHRHNFTSS